MINLQSTNTQMMDELLSDRKKALYWFIKKQGGEKAYIRMQDKLLNEACKTKQNVSSEIMEYRSPGGNRWMVFEYASYYPEAKASNTKPYIICFYETLGGIGAFVPITITDSNKSAIIIFTSHFFKRLSERLGVCCNSLDLLSTFFQYIPYMHIEYKKGDNSMLIRLPGSTGWGVLRDGGGLVFEVRTFLTDAQLSKRQLQKISSIRSYAEKVKNEPLDITLIRLKKMGDNETEARNELKRMMEHYYALGRNKQFLQKQMDVYMWIGMLLGNMNYVSADDNVFWMRMGKMNQKILDDYVNGNDRCVEGFLSLIDTCLRTMKIRRFDKKKARQILKNLEIVSEQNTLIPVIPKQI